MKKPKIKQVGNIVQSKIKNPIPGRVYDPIGLAPCLNTGVGGGHKIPYVIVLVTQ